MKEVIVMKKFVILGLVLLVLLSVAGFAQEEPVLPDTVPSDVAMEEDLEEVQTDVDVESLPEDIGMEAMEPEFDPEPVIATAPETEMEEPVEEPAEVTPENIFPERRIVGPAVGFVVLYIIILIALFGIMIAAFVFWIFMIVDCAKRDFKKENEKVVWILILALVGVIGAIIYYFAVRRPAKKT